VQPSSSPLSAIGLEEGGKKEREERVAIHSLVLKEGKRALSAYRSLSLSPDHPERGGGEKRGGIAPMAGSAVPLKKKEEDALLAQDSRSRPITYNGGQKGRIKNNHVLTTGGVKASRVDLVSPVQFLIKGGGGREN